MSVAFKTKNVPSCRLYSRPRMYADDTTLTSAAEDVDILQVKMNQFRSKHNSVMAKGE